METREVVLIKGVRTPFGRMGGVLKDFTSTQLAGFALKGLLKKTGIDKKDKIDAVFAGSAGGDLFAGNPARYALLSAGMSYETSASYIEMQCGSGIDALNHAAWKIAMGEADVIIAGGMESYSQAYFRVATSSIPYRLKAPIPHRHRLTPVEKDNLVMGLVAENMQQKWKISREDQDDFALKSQIKAKKALDAGNIEPDIIPVTIPATRKKSEIIISKDEHPRPDVTSQDLAKLKPAFKHDGTITAGNSSGLNDGAAFILLMSMEKAVKLGYKPFARWVKGADCGVDPKIMGIAPAYAIPMALKRAGLKLKDLDVIECNEAFAVQNLSVIKELENKTGEKANPDKWNPMGGAIAFGHPNGASGARIGMFAMKYLAQNKLRYGLISSCCGGGLGVATIIENLC